MSARTYTSLLWNSSSPSLVTSRSSHLYTSFNPPKFRLGDYGTLQNGQLVIEGNLLAQFPALDTQLGRPILSSAPKGWNCASTAKDGHFERLSTLGRLDDELVAKVRGGWKYDDKPFAALVPVDPIFATLRDEGMIIQFLKVLKAGLVEVDARGPIDGNKDGASDSDTDTETISDARTQTSTSTKQHRIPTPNIMELLEHINNKVIVTSVLICTTYCQILSIGAPGEIDVSFRHGKFIEEDAGWSVSYGESRPPLSRARGLVRPGAELELRAMPTQDRPRSSASSQSRIRARPATHMASYEPGAFQHTPMVGLKRISLDGTWVKAMKDAGGCLRRWWESVAGLFGGFVHDYELGWDIPRLVIRESKDEIAARV